MSEQVSLVVSRFVFTISALMLAGSVAAQPGQSFSTLEERMTGQEFRESGLHKLSDEELAALNRWIRLRSLAEGEVPEGLESAARRSRADTDTGASGDRRGFRERDRSDRSPIRSRIDGSFSGWSGNTQFVLENGMVWRQAEGGNFHISEVENPEVEISPGMFGTWRLSVEGYGSSVRVERVR